jgi:DNA (cytosine-5)-methyltransferase 1
MFLQKIPVIDLFAGPGGLGEGFSHSNGRTKFDVRLSFEVDPIACQTLRLRSFFRLSEGTPARKSYYAVMRGELTVEQLKAKHKALWDEATSHIIETELGSPETKLSVHKRIRAAVSGSEFVLIGGPPCQAYSIIGRSRRLGVASESNGRQTIVRRQELAREFYKDPKHRLYREYLEILAVHRPVAFIMENVKGLGSARTGINNDAGGMFGLIQSDLQNPKRALEHEIPAGVLNEFGTLKDARYRLFTLAERHPDKPKSLFPGSQPPAASDFVVRSEDYGVPQARHRIIILGLRSDVAEIPETLSRQKPLSVREVLKGLPRIRSTVSGKNRDWAEAFRNESWRVPPGIKRSLGWGAALEEILNSSRRLSNGRAWVSSEPSIRPNSGALRFILDPELKGTAQHEARSHMPSDLVRYLYCALFAQKYGRSPVLTEWPGDLLPNHANVESEYGKVTTRGFDDRFKVQGLIDSVRGPQPSSTVTSHIAKDGHYYIHFDPSQCRSLTVREATRLQTFPDNYFFCGNRTQQYHQVGNAVPPYLVSVRRVCESGESVSGGSDLQGRNAL